MGEAGACAALRTAKRALDDGLITAADFDCVKVAFLRAQQIKAGLDAGFIKAEDYDKAVQAYMHALDFQLMSAVPSLSAPTAAAARGHAPAAAAAAPTAAPAAAPAAAAPPAAAHAAGGAAAAAAAAAAPASFGVCGRLSSSSGQGIPTASANGHSAALLQPAAPGGSGSLSAQTSVSSDGCADIPADLPDYCKGATAGKKSMSGIAIDEACVNLFMHLKTRSAFKWLIFKVDSSGRLVVPDKIGVPGSTYNDFVIALPEDQCRYAVYDYEYRSPERGTFKKLVFLLWAPDTTGIKPKMMYASTKDFFKGFLDGIGAELQANEPSELSEEEMRERVESTMTRK